MKFNTRSTLLTLMWSHYSSWLIHSATRIVLQLPYVPLGHTCWRLCIPVFMLNDGLVRPSLQYHGMVVATILGDKYNLNLCYKTCSSQLKSYFMILAFPCKWSNIIIMQDDNQYGGVNEDLIGGIEDVDKSMMETMFNLSTYVRLSKTSELTHHSVARKQLVPRQRLNAMLRIFKLARTWETPTT